MIHYIGDRRRFAGTEITHTIAIVTASLLTLSITFIGGAHAGFACLAFALHGAIAVPAIAGFAQVEGRAAQHAMDPQQNE